MEWDEKEADASDTIDKRGAGGGGGGAMPDLGDILGGVLGGQGGAGSAGGGGMGGGLGGALGGGGLGLGKKGGCLGIVMMLVAAVLLPKLLGGGGFDVSSMSKLDKIPQFPSGGELPSEGAASDASIPASEDPDAELASFAKVLITDTNDVWQDQFEKANRKYSRAKLVLFSGGVQSGCGPASADMGPFYCPADNLVYIDLGFFQELDQRFGAAGDFAQAYVIAHEVGHHVQNELGISDQVRKLEQEDPDAGKGEDGLSVRLELQADCLAGIWAHSRYERGQADPTKRLEDGDIDEALDAAEAVGDDSIQKAATGRVNPEGFTHGSAKQRKKWFKVGYDSGDSDKCDTFSADPL